MTCTFIQSKHNTRRKLTMVRVLGVAAAHAAGGRPRGVHRNHDKPATRFLFSDGLDLVRE
jgi:hypothetical protein